MWRYSYPTIPVHLPLLLFLTSQGRPSEMLTSTKTTLKNSMLVFVSLIGKLYPVFVRRKNSRSSSHSFCFRCANSTVQEKSVHEFNQLHLLTSIQERSENLQSSSRMQKAMLTAHRLELILLEGKWPWLTSISVMPLTRISFITNSRP